MTNLNSPTELLAAAREVLIKNAFAEVKNHRLPEFDSSFCCIFEDAFSLVTIVYFNTWGDLVRGWKDAQASFVELISRHISREDRKSWEGYLLLWTTDLVPTTDTDKVQQIEYNTGRVRKLVSTGENLPQVADVAKVLLPLLPILPESFGKASNESVLARIPSLLQSEQLSQEKLQAVIDAFDKNESILETIHNFRERTQ